MRYFPLWSSNSNSFLIYFQNCSELQDKGVGPQKMFSSPDVAGWERLTSHFTSRSVQGLGEGGGRDNETVCPPDVADSI